MKIWGSQALRAIAFATLIFAAFLPAPAAHAVKDPEKKASTETTLVTNPLENEPLYRVRVGGKANGETAGRFYIERNIHRAETELSIIGDYDADGDGWAVIGRTDEKHDGKAQSSFWIDAMNRPHILLNGDKLTCAQLKPSNLGRVVEHEDRVLQAEMFSRCMRPMFLVVPESPAAPVQSHANSSHVDELQETEVTVDEPDVQQVEVVETPQATDADVATVQQADGLTTADSGSVQIVPAAGNVEGAVTVAPSTHPDIPSKKNDDPDLTTQVTNTFIVGGSIVSAVLLGIFLLARTSLMLNK